MSSKFSRVDYSIQYLLKFAFFFLFFGGVGWGVAMQSVILEK